MIDRERWMAGLERFFFIYLFINPILDILNGVYIYFLQLMKIQQPVIMSQLSPSLVLRVGVLMLMGVYILLNQDLLSILSILLIALAGVFSIVCETFIGARYGFFSDIQYVARFVYNIAALAVMTAFFRRRYSPENAKELLRRVFTWTSVLMSGSVIGCFVLSAILPMRIGFYSSADRFGTRGSSGFYHAANEAVAILMLLLPVTLCDFFAAGGFRDKKNWPRLLAPALVVNAMLLTGTKTAFVALAAALLFVLAYQFIQVRKTRDKVLRGRCLKLVALIAGIFVFLSAFGMAKTVIASILRLEKILTEEDQDFGHIEEEDRRESWQNAHPITRLLLSGREYYLRKAGREWFEGGAPFVLFGLARGSQAHIIEMDGFEVLFYYGLFGLIVMVYPYAVRIRGVLRRREKGLPFLCVLLALALTFGYSFIAGHVYFSVTGGFYFVLMLLYGELHKQGGEVVAGGLDGARGS